MGFGLRVYNDGGGLQVSSEARQMSLYAKGTHDLGSNPRPAPPGTYRSTLQAPGAGYPFLAIRPRDIGTRVAVSQRDPNTANFRFISNRGAGWLVDWWLFDAPQPAPDNFGLRVYDQYGRLTYHDALLPLRLVGNGISGVPDGRTYAVIQGSLSGVRQYQPGLPPRGQELDPDQFWYYPHYLWNAIGRDNDQTIDYQYTDLDYATSNPILNDAPPDYYYGPPNFMTVDVTGY